MANKTIGNLPKADQVQDDSLFVMEQQGEAMSASGARFREFAEEAGRQGAARVQKGATFIPDVTPNGTISWTNDAGLPNPPAVTLPGVDSFNAEVRKAAPVNLLDNSDFTNPINQRGLTTYAVGSRRYTIDRWIATNSVKVTVNGGSVTVENTSSTDRASFIQYFGVDCVPASGEALTIACKMADGTVYCGSLNMPTSGQLSVFKTANGTNLYVAAASDTYPARVYAYFAASGKEGFAWMAVYKGVYTIDTLPEYQPKGYLAELETCKWYFERIKNDAGYNLTLGVGVGSATSLYFNLKIAPKRATPSAAALTACLSNLLYGQSSLASTPTAISVLTTSLESGYISLQLTGTFTAAAAYRVGLAANSYLDFDCDLV